MGRQFAAQGTLSGVRRECEILGLIFLAFFAWARPISAETFRATSSADTTLFESAPDFNMGGEWHVAVGTTGSMGSNSRNRGLFKFALEPIPSGSVIQSVTLALKVTGIPGRDGGGGPASSTFTLHRVLRDWGEGDKAGLRGDVASRGEANWKYRQAPDAKGAGGSAWSAPGAAAPVDFSPGASAAHFVSSVGAYEFGSTSNLVADVQMWVDFPARNFGWILLSGSETQPKTARRIGSREDTNHAPGLTIEYVPPDGPRIEGVQRTATQIQFQFTAAAAQPYFVQFRDLLGADSWQTFTNIAAQNSATNVVVSDLISVGRRFYRVGRP